MSFQLRDEQRYPQRRAPALLAAALATPGSEAWAAVTALIDAALADYAPGGAVTTTIRIAAPDSSATAKAAADVVCDGTADNVEITAALSVPRSRVVLYDGTYTIADPITVASGAILDCETVRGVVFECNTVDGVFVTDNPLTRHEHVYLSGGTILTGNASSLALDLRGFTRSSFDRWRIHDFDYAALFGGTLQEYEASWTNRFSNFYLSRNLVGVHLEGDDPVNGTGGTANNIQLVSGEIIVKDDRNAIAIDVVHGQPVVLMTDIGYGDQGHGIVLRPGAVNARIAFNRFEWGDQDADRYPILIEAESYYHTTFGNMYSEGCTKPNVYDANGPGAGRLLQLDAFQSNDDYPDGFVEFNIDAVFSRKPSFPNGFGVALSSSEAFAAQNGSGDYLFSVDTSTPRVLLNNGMSLRVNSGDFSGQVFLVNGSSGLTTIAGGGWNSGHLVLGSHHLWIDGSGNLRIKSSAPGSDTDGAVVGAQS